MLQQSLDTKRIEQAASIPDPGARRRKAEQGPAPVRFVTGPRDEPEPEQPAELEGDGARGDAQPAGQLSRRNGTDWIEVLEDAGEVGAQANPGGGFVDVTTPAGREHQGNRAHDLAGRPGGGGRHCPKAGEDSLVCQIKLVVRGPG